MLLSSNCSIAKLSEKKNFGTRKYIKLWQRFTLICAPSAHNDCDYFEINK